MHSGRTLAVKGEQQVQCVGQSVSSSTHRYTIQPTISGYRRLLSPLFIIFKERGGEFGPIVEANLFQPVNVYVTPSKSDKLTTGMNIHFLTYLFVHIIKLNNYKYICFFQILLYIFSKYG